MEDAEVDEWEDSDAVGWDDTTPPPPEPLTDYAPPPTQYIEDTPPPEPPTDYAQPQDIGSQAQYPQGSPAPPQYGAPPPTPQAQGDEGIRKRFPSGGILAVVGGLLVVLGTFMPWFTVTASGSTVDANGFMFPLFALFSAMSSSNSPADMADSWFVVLLPTIVIVLGAQIITLAGVRRPTGAAIFSSLSLVMGVFLYGLLTTLISEGGSMNITIGYGLMAIIFGSILGLIGGIVGRSQLKKQSQKS